jgi:hypothetical protein
VIERDILKKLADTVQDSFGGLMRQHFPNASALELWGSSMTFNLDKNTAILRCAGEEKEVPLP